jgi:O-antigen ligase
LALVVAACGALEALYGLEQTARAAGPASFQIGAVSRAYGAFGRPNSFAGYLELTLFPPLWLGVHYLTRLPRALSEYRSARLRGLAASRPERARLCWTAALAGGLLGCAALILGGIVASFSRGAWLGVALAGLVTVLLYARWTRVVTLALAPLAALLLLGGAAHVVPASVSGRLGSIVDEARPFDASTITITPENFAAVERMAHWQAGWHMFTHHPALGVGVGNFNTRYPDYYVRATFRVSQGHAHNIYIQMLAETGIAGLFAYLILILSFLWLALWIVIHAPNGFARMLALGAFGTQLSVAAHNVFEDLEVLNLGVQLAAIWVLTLAALCLWRQGRATADLASVEYCPS